MFMDCPRILRAPILEPHGGNVYEGFEFTYPGYVTSFPLSICTGLNCTSVSYLRNLNALNIGTLLVTETHRAPLHGPQFGWDAPVMGQETHVTPLFRTRSPFVHASTVLAHEVTHSRAICGNMLHRSPKSPVDSLSRVTSARKDAPNTPYSIHSTPCPTSYKSCMHTYSIFTTHRTPSHLEIY